MYQFDKEREERLLSEYLGENEPEEVDYVLPDANFSIIGKIENISPEGKKNVCVTFKEACVYPYDEKWIVETLADKTLLDEIERRGL